MIWHKYKWVISHIWTSHVTHMDGSCPTYKRVMSHMWWSHVAHVRVIPHKCRSVTTHPHTWTSHVTRQRVMSHTWTSHLTQINESCLTHEFVMPHIWTSHVAHMQRQPSALRSKFLVSRWTKHAAHLTSNLPHVPEFVAHMQILHILLHICRSQTSFDMCDFEFLKLKFRSSNSN